MDDRFDLTGWEGDSLAELEIAISVERQIQGRVKLLKSGRCREFVVWGPGPPYYCIPYCKLPNGHEGEHEPHMTPDECREAWVASSSAFSDRTSVDDVLIEAEVARRMG